jgi:pSer/pThr/pTyr-binding forkhead associated (FHA) protein
VGRSVDADFTLNHQSVSRCHLEITLTDQDRFFCVDRASASGTFVWRQESWQRIKQGYVDINEHISLGKKQLPFSELVVALKQLDNTVDIKPQSFDLLSVKPRRNRETGEVE